LFLPVAARLMGPSSIFIAKRFLYFIALAMVTFERPIALRPIGGGRCNVASATLGQIRRTTAR
jgi:hypothetical protein